MQPTAQAVGDLQKDETSPAGAKETLLNVECFLSPRWDSACIWFD